MRHGRRRFWIDTGNAQFQSELEALAFHWLPLAISLFGKMATTYASMPATAFLRGADALHLASAAGHGFTEIFSNDRHLLAAAPFFGLKGINVIPA
jgi:predicted nucleic acid-binding protein